MDVDAGGHRLRMLIVGVSGPTVVLESGLGGGLGWEQVRAEVGRFARVVTYDRAGFGESESGPRPRTAPKSQPKFMRRFIMPICRLRIFLSAIRWVVPMCAFLPRCTPRKFPA